MKKLNIFALMLLLIGQTILGPIATVSASEFDVPPIEDEIVEGEQGGNDGIVGEEGPSDESTTPGEDEEESPEEPTTPEVGEDESGEDSDPEETPEVPAVCEDEGVVEEDELLEGQEALDNEEEEASDCLDFELFAAPYDSEMPVSVIESVNFSIGGNQVDLSQPVNVENGDTAAFEFNFSLPAGHDGGNYGDGTTLTYVLPEIFENANIDKYGDQLGNGMGTVAVVGRTVTITFNDKLNGYVAMGGSFWVEADFSSSNTEWTKDIELIENEVITLNFQSKGGDKVTKIGTPDNDGKNSKFIDWTVTVNTDDGSTGTHSFVDELTGPHTFVAGSIEVKEIPITPSGPGAVATNPIIVTPAQSIVDNKLTIDLPNKAHTGYQIKYQTEVGDAGNVLGASFDNKVTYNETPKSDNQYITFGDPLAKSKSGPDTNQVTTWTIDYNFNNRNIDQDKAVLEDTWEVNGGSGATPKQDLVPNSFVVYEEDGTTVVDASQYTMTPKASGNGFKLSFKQDVTKPYVIQYQTKPNGVYPTTDFTVTNVVKRADMTETKTATANYTKKNLLLNKSTNGIDYGKKEMSWKIVANQSKYELPKDTVFEDTYGDTNMALNGRKPTVNLPESNYDFAPTIVDGKETGFKITLKEVVSSEITITYTTDYEIKDSGQDDRDRTYENTVTILSSNLPVDPTDSAEHTIIDEQKNNGKKEGYYDYATKIFHWDVELNFNYNELDNAVFEDELPATQKVESIVVQEGTLNAAGQFVPDSIKTIANTSGAEHKIKLALGNITGPHKVTYTSKDADGVFPHGNDTVKIENIAKLSSDAGVNASWDEKVEVKHTDRIFNKSGSQKGLSAIINWNFEFNYAQSELKQVVIKDTIGKDGTDAVQMILPDSFKVYKVTVTGQTPDNPNTSAHTLVDASKYTLDVDVENGTFTLDLGDVDTAYYVTYDTMFTGDKNAPITNEVEVIYVSPDGISGADQAAVSNFNYGNIAWTRSVPFVIIKTDAATGEVMKDVEFTLYGPYTGDTPLFKGKTDENGVLDFGVQFAEALGANQYTLKETKFQDYTNPDVTFNLDLDSDQIITGGAYDGYQLVSVENVKENAGPACIKFTLTVEDADGEVRPDVQVKLVNKNTGKTVIAPATTNLQGQVVIDRTVLSAGPYEVFEIDGQSEVKLGEVAVQYVDCEGKVTSAPACTVFTITVKDKDGNVRPNVKKVTVEDTNRNPVLTNESETNADGEITLPNTTKPGTYNVYEGEVFLGQITVSYVDNGVDAPCQAEVAQAPTCDTFTLTVNKSNNQPNKDATITIKDSDGQVFTDGNGNDSFITNADGEVIIELLPAGTYTVYEGNKKIGNPFIVKDECSATVKAKSTSGGVGPGPACTEFTLTVKDAEDFVRGDVDVTLKNEAGTDVLTGKTNEQGQITIGNGLLIAGEYTVFEGDVELGTVTVDFTEGNCEGVVGADPVDPAVCTEFTIIVKDEEGNVRENVEVTVKDAAGETVLEGTTDADGKITVPNTVPAGEYSVFEGETELGKVTVDFTEGNCQGVVGTPVDPAVCTEFTIIVKDAEGNVREGVKVAVKDAAGEVVTTGTTDADGKITVSNTVVEGDYTVFEGEIDLGKVTVDFTEGNCQGEVTTPVKPVVCTDFTIIVKDAEGNVRDNVVVTVKDAAGNVVASGTTDADGKITVPNTVPAGDYTVFEGETELGKVTISFTDGKCQAVVGNPNEPVEPGPGEPNPGEPGPGEPNPGEPGPGNPNPGEPGPGNPNPENPNPGNPGTPGTPGGVTPGTPGGVTPGTPGGVTPGTPGGVTPGTPGGVKPGTPGGVTPGTPGEETPGTPGGVTPGTPGGETPGTPGGETPGTPGEETPGTPGGVTPEVNPENPDNVGTDNEQGEGNNFGKDDTTKNPNASVHGSGDENAEGGLLGNAGGEQATLPQTGEQNMLYMMIFGFALILMGGMMIGRRKTNE